jgi:hypothetical protein
VITGLVEEPHQDLVEHDVVEHLSRGNGGKCLAESSRVRTASLDQFSDSGSSERIAAYTGKPRARRENSGFQSSWSRGPSGSAWTRYPARTLIAAW